MSGMTTAPRLGPVWVLMGASALWGLSWWPLKALHGTGLSAPQVSVLAYGGVGALGLILLWRARAAWRAHRAWVLGLLLVGGWANASFVNALMMGEVVRVMFLFYLSPVWSVLGGRWLLGERITPLRLATVVLALCGLWLVLVGPRGPEALLQGEVGLGLVDLLALSAGLAFAGNNLLARGATGLNLQTKTVSVFVGSATMSLLAIAVLGQGWPQPTAGALLGALGYSLGLLLATVGWQYGVSHMEAGRSGVIVLAELVVAVLTALWWGDGQLSAAGWVGGALITLAAVLEAAAGGGEPA